MYESRLGATTWEFDAITDGTIKSSRDLWYISHREWEGGGRSPSPQRRSSRRSQQLYFPSSPHNPLNLISMAYIDENANPYPSVSAAGDFTIYPDFNNAPSFDPLAIGLFHPAVGPPTEGLVPDFYGEHRSCHLTSWYLPCGLQIP